MKMLSKMIAITGVGATLFLYSCGGSTGTSNDTNNTVGNETDTAQSDVMNSTETGMGATDSTSTGTGTGTGSAGSGSTSGSGTSSDSTSRP